MAKKLAIVARLPPLHPGEVLREEFLGPMGLTPYAVAKACGVPVCDPKLQRPCD